jgi:predicted nucleic acid-binding protein
MTSPLVVSNASVLIALEQIGQLDLLQNLFGSITIPPAVTRETAPTVTLPSWVTERALTQPLSAQIIGASLGAGESEAIGLSLEVGASWVILDDRPARRLAQALNLSVIGTLGILVLSKRRSYLSLVRRSLDGLIQRGFRVAPDLYERVLSSVGEWP